jgi:multiple sugar transport system permease protein
MKFRSRKLNEALYHFFVILFGLFMIYPLLWMLSASFKNNVEIFQGLNFFPKEPTMGNYINGWKGVSGYSFGRFLYNSMAIAVINILANIISCSMAAYAFAKLKFKLSKILFSVMMLTMMLPFHVRLIPQYIIFNKLGWINTFLPRNVLSGVKCLRYHASPW